MTSTNSVTLWIEQLKSGDSGAAQRLWESYFQRMVELARRKLQGAPRSAADEEDVALSAFNSFCLGLREGRFSQLLDSDNLWPLLMAITAHKSVDLIRAQNRIKRGGAGNNPDKQPENTPIGLPPVPLSQILSREPDPVFTAELSENFQRLLQRLDATGDADLRQITILKMQGHTSSEIAQQLDCVSRTVERKLQLIARLWEKDIPA